MTAGQNALPSMSMILATFKCMCTHTIHTATVYSIQQSLMPQLTNKLSYLVKPVNNAKLFLVYCSSLYTT